ncbi:ComF family protein, partial [Patescibacteria group bacterium]|nr:ComF family protein [Patescibacteria group bacterium]
MLSGNKTNKINSLTKHLWDFLFPINCVGCKTEGVWLCQSCINKINTSKNQICPVCKKISGSGKIHKSCLPSSSLDGIIAASLYKEPIIKTAIHNYKYQGAKDISQVLSWLIVDYLNNIKTKPLGKIDLVIPVPLHKKKFLQRGFNQTAEIAQQVCNYFDWQYGDYLLRNKYTKTQTKQNAKERQLNVNEVFQLKDNINVKGKNIVLIDDVITTGSTLQECANTLKKAGAVNVWGLAVA